MSDGNTSMEDGFFDSLLGDFLDESDQLLSQLGEHLLQLDEWTQTLEPGQPARCDDELMNEMFRAAHSLKGLSAMLGLSQINSITHRVENVFDAARNDQLTFSSHSVEVLFQSVDCLVALVDRLKDSSQEDVDCDTVIDAIENILAATGAQRATTSQSDAEAFLAEVTPAVEETRQTESTEMPKTEIPQPAEPMEVEQLSGPMPPEDHFKGITDEDDVPAKYLSIFIDETEMSLDTLTETLLSVETTDDSQAIESLLVVSHRIKGSSAAVGLNRPAKLAHFMEDLLQQLREQKATLTSTMADAMLRCTDALRAYVAGLKNSQADSACFNELTLDLIAASTDTSTATPPNSESPPTEAAIPEPTPSVSNSENLLADIAAEAPLSAVGFVGRIWFDPEFPLVGLKAQLLSEKLTHLGKVFHSKPSRDELDSIEVLESLTFGVVTEMESDQLQKTLQIVSVQRIELTPLSDSDAKVEPDQVASKEPIATQVAAPVAALANTSNAAPKPPAPKPTANIAKTPPAARERSESKTSDNRPAETLRVDIDRLDHLMNLAGQLVINKARFSQIGEGLREITVGKKTSQLLINLQLFLNSVTKINGKIDEKTLVADVDLLATTARRLQNELLGAQEEMTGLTRARHTTSDLLETVHQLDRITDGIQKTIMDTRMVPIGPLFGRFRRVIRDISRSNNKQIDLVIRGEKTELDKRMIDELGDPLIHMVRNSADHGIESPEDRIAAGKPARGTVSLDAFHRGNSIIIQVIDDGKGLDADKILAKAIDKGLVTKADSEKLTPHQIFQMVWEPGFSTAEKVTEVSGRGMGMDIAKSKIEDINGSVDLDSTPGVGTTFTIRLPLTLAILPSLLTVIDDDVYAMPVESVIEIVRVPRAELKTVHQKETANVRGRVVSVVYLADLFQWEGLVGHIESKEDVTLVIIGSENRQIALVVDSLLGEEDVVIKSMAENYKNVRGIAGASILGDGRVSLILDTSAIIDMSSKTESVEAI